MSLRIDRIKVENYRNFLDFELDDFPPSAVIVGENEAGKSNLIRALRLVLDPDMPAAERTLDEQDISSFSSGVTAGVEVKIEVDLVGFDLDDTLKSILSDFCIATKPYKARLTYEFSPVAKALQIMPESDEINDHSPEPEGDAVSNRDHSIDDYDWHLFGADDRARTIHASELQRVAIQLVGALRDAERELTSARRRNPLRQILADVTPERDRLAQTAKLLNDASDHLLEDESVGAAEKAIAAEIERLTGAALEVEPTLGLATADPERLLRQARLFLDQDRTRAVGDVSLGVANIVFLSLLFRAIEHRREKRSRAAVLLAIEEPEAHLHVQIQRRLFRTLIAEEQGVLVTTHSPHLASVTPLNRVVLLRKCGDRGTLPFRAIGANLNDDEAADIERYMTVTRAELLFARFVILVEGDAEQYIVPALASTLGFDLDEYGISVVSVQGTDFKPYRRLLGSDALAIPSVAITDGDTDIETDDSVTVGLRRGANLIEKSDGVKVVEYLDSAHKKNETLNVEDSRRLVQFLGKQGVFVGIHTLEIDLARLAPTAAIAAASEMMGRVAADNHSKDLTQISGTDSTKGIRTRFLNRIDDIGKGRFAQRWAQHLSDKSVREDIGAQYEGAGRSWAELPAGYLLEAIDCASLHVRGISLVAPAEQDAK
jgi:putative ATP-dependent endonuclease of OLD family